MNDVLRKLTIENYLNLKAAFDNSKKIFTREEDGRLIHPGEFGTYRERLIKQWLRLYVPSKYEITSGFVINSNNEVSTQCDIIIYDKRNTPQIESNEKQSFYPVETVVAIGEVKSDINSAPEINQYLEKLSKTKSLRDRVANPKPYFQLPDRAYNPSIYPFDSVFTFLICNKFNGIDISKDFINYECERHHKHNLILSLEDCLITYEHRGRNLPTPIANQEDCAYKVIEKTTDELSRHIERFITSFDQGISFTTLLKIDMTHYLTNAPRVMVS